MAVGGYRNEVCCMVSAECPRSFDLHVGTDSLLCLRTKRSGAPLIGMSVCGLRRQVCATEALILLWTYESVRHRPRNEAKAAGQMQTRISRLTFHGSWKQADNHAGWLRIVRRRRRSMSDRILARIIHEGSLRTRADAKRDGHSEAGDWLCRLRQCQSPTYSCSMSKG
jgi:hypothetical protein